MAVENRAIIVFFVAVAALWRQAVLLTWQDVEREKREIKRERDREQRDLNRDQNLENLATELIAAKTAASGTIATNTLKKRTLRTAHDLFAFLKRHGPEPPNPIDHLATLDKEWKEIGDSCWPFKNKILHSYARSLHPQVVELLHELAERSTNAPSLEDFGIDPEKRVEPSALRELAETLLIIAARMD